MNNTTPLDRGFNAAVLHIASKLFPTGFDVSPDAPNTLAELRDHVARTGRMVVSSLNSENTIYGDAEVNYAARAWHDHSHLVLGAAFDVDGEEVVALHQQGQLIALYGREKSLPWRNMIEAEVVGQIRHLVATGAYPTDQRAFDVAYLDAMAPTAWPKAARYDTRKE